MWDANYLYAYETFLFDISDVSPTQRGSQVAVSSLLEKEKKKKELPLEHKGQALFFFSFYTKQSRRKVLYLIFNFYQHLTT